VYKSKSDVEKMNVYIRNTRMGKTARYCLTIGELQAVYLMIQNGKAFEALEMMFNYGQAKGYRMARRARKNEAPGAPDREVRPA